MSSENIFTTPTKQQPITTSSEPPGAPRKSKPNVDNVEVVRSVSVQPMRLSF